VFDLRSPRGRNEPAQLTQGVFTQKWLGDQGSTVCRFALNKIHAIGKVYRKCVDCIRYLGAGNGEYAADFADLFVIFAGSVYCS
jgi:hypothetical protein